MVFALYFLEAAVPRLASEVAADPDLIPAYQDSRDMLLSVVITEVSITKVFNDWLLQAARSARSDGMEVRRVCMYRIDGTKGKKGWDSLAIDSHLLPAHKKRSIDNDEIAHTSHVMTDTNIEACANCGKGEEESVDLKACTACYLVKYCNRDCQAAHRTEHKKACKKRAAELHEEALFTQPPQKEDCPICFLPFPPIANAVCFKACCRKHVCKGCMHAHVKLAFQGREELGKCEFCRQIDVDTEEEKVVQIRELVNKNDPNAMEILARRHAMGDLVQQDFVESNRLLLKAGKLGNPQAYYNLGHAYYQGLGVETSVTKAKKYWELAAIGGNVNARMYLGETAGYQGNEQRAYKHFIIGARSGHKECLDKVRIGFQRGVVTKDDYSEALKEYQKRQEETRSELRDEAERYEANPVLYEML